MREININIEGYNVNGICVACLNYNRKMFYHGDVKECLRILANIDVPDGLTVQVCWECLARMRYALKFRVQILKAYDYLIKYSRKHTFLDSPSDLSSYAIENLSVCTHDCITLGSPADVKDETGPNDPQIKSELDEKIELKIDMTEPKIEDDRVQFVDEPDFFDDVPSPANDVLSSDDDIQLSKLKALKKKEKKIKKNRKERVKREDKSKEDKTEKPSRRKKNLPEDLVELYTMAEEEMWQVRNSDRECEEFTVMKHGCSNCIIGFQTQKQMDYHMAGKHSQKTDSDVQCDVCKGYFVSAESLATHRSLHLTAYRCRKCGYSTTMKRIMQLHLYKRHGAGELHTCHECGKEFSTKSKLTYHKVQCSREKPQCDCCGKVFANKMTLRIHLKPPPQNDSAKTKQFIPCKGCDKVFFSRKSYRAHVVIHDGLTYPCPICGKLFQWKRNLSRHTRNHRERAAGTTHRCRDCDKSFASRDCYNNHMRLSKRHVAASAYVHTCHYCGKKFATKWCMVDHIDWDHLKRIKYQCSVCFKAFKTAKIMVAHMNNIHEGRNKKPDGEHLCDVCGKSYKTVKRLKGHVWSMHTKRSQSKSYKCSLCPATFTWQTSIYKHMKMMHDNNKRKHRAPPIKKPEPYPEVELANRMQYFQQNIASSLAQNIVQQTPLNIVQNL